MPKIDVIDFDGTITKLGKTNFPNGIRSKEWLSKIENIKDDIFDAETFQIFVKQRLSQGVKILIATYSDVESPKWWKAKEDKKPLEERKTINPDDCLAGELLVKAYLQVIFKDELEIVEQISIQAFMPQDRTTGKNTHIEKFLQAQAWVVGADIKPEDITLYDDARENLNAAKEKSYRTVAVSNGSSSNNFATENFTAVLMHEMTSVAQLAEQKDLSSASKGAFGFLGSQEDVFSGFSFGFHPSSAVSPPCSQEIVQLDAAQPRRLGKSQ